jgi:glyoxylase-like metal-dependent hydrolase (beta-lactamase superfamily II)
MRKLRTALIGLGLAASLAAAPDALADLTAVAQAMGADRLDSIQVSGAGYAYAVGQAYQPGEAWPKLNLPRYTRVDDYAKGAHSFDYALSRAEVRGGGAIPQIGEVRRTGGVVGDQGWNVVYPQGTAAQAGAAVFQHDLWVSPHGVVKAALADKAVMSGSTFEVARAGRFRARALVNGQNLVEKVESWIDNPVLGDMAVVTTYADYRDHGGVKFPARITQTMGGYPVLELNVAEVKVNAGSVAAPPSITPAVVEVKVDKAAEGVWFVHGGSHHSVAVEMRDHVVVIEAPLGDARTNAALDAVRKAVPGKPIRYVVPTHHHFDHSGGLRAAAAADAVLVVPEVSRAFYEKAYAAPRTLNPDTLAKAGKQAKFETYRDKHVLSDGSRTIELHTLRENVHAQGFTVAYLPAEKILIVADAFSPRAPVTQTPANINPATTNLWENIERLKLDVQTVLPIHGRMVKVDELRLEAGAARP